MKIFLDNSDYKRFQELLYIANSKKTKRISDIKKSPYPVWEIERGETLVDIGAYCPMPNHFHLLLRAKSKEDVALFLQRLQLSYSKYYNNKYEHSGTLFQGKSKATHIRGNRQLKYVFSYIHLNIVKLIQKDWRRIGIKNIKKVKEYLQRYKYSSYCDFIGENRDESKILNKSAFPDYFPNREKFEREIFDWLNYGKNNENE